MDIYKILSENRDSIINEDLEFFEIELAVGDYEKQYIDKCLELINDIRIFRRKPLSVDNSDKNIKEDYTTIELDENKNFVSNINLQNESEEQKVVRIKNIINNARNSKYSITSFEKIIKENHIDEKFVDMNYTLFKPTEIDELLKLLSFSEEFLNKYYKLLNKNLISEYQYFSEDFFIKHIKDLNAKIVFTKGKNEWIKKENRSSKLTVFLKLKGIKL